MLSKKQRLSRKNFSSVFSLGKKKRTDLYLLLYLKKQIPPQFSVVVSKKVSKGSVVRHVIKRRVYHIIHLFLRDNPEFSYSCIFIISPSIQKHDFVSVKEHIFKSLRDIS